MTGYLNVSRVGPAGRGAIALALLSGTALASTAPSARAEDARSDLQEVVVTAERRETSVLKAPASIAVVSGGEMAERNITNVKDLVSQVPGVMIGSHAGYTILSVRGISTTDARSDASIALYEDGVYTGRQFAPNLSYLDLARTEVLRGPQGALYGRNATGGVIAYFSAQPTAGFEGRGKVLQGNYNRFRSEAMLSGPVAPNVGLRATAFYEERDGYYTNILTGQNVGKHRDWGGRARARVDFTPNLSLDLIARHGEGKGSDIVISLTEPLPPPAFGLVPAFRTAIASTTPFKVSQNQNNQSAELRASTVTAILRWSLAENITLTGQSAWTFQRESREGFDSDGTSFQATFSDFRAKEQVYQNNLYVDAKLGPIQTSTGISHYEEKYFIGVYTALAPTAPFATLPTGSVNVLQLNQNTRSIAVFSDNIYHVTDRFRLAAGVRANWDKRDAVRTAGASLPVLPGYPLPNTPVPGPLNPAAGAITSVVCIDRASEAKFDSTVFKAGAQFDVDDRNMAYASANQGFKAGGFNGGDCSEPFNPEKITSYEIGIKGRLFDGWLTYEISAFHFDYRDLQVQQIVGVAGVITNAGKASGDGVDMTLAAPLGRRFMVDVTAGFLNAEYDDYCSPKDPVFPGGFPGQPGAYPLDCTVPGSNPAVLGTQLKGVRLNRAPSVQGTAGLTYENEVPGLGVLRVRGEVFHASDVVLRPFSKDPGATQEAYTLVNLYASLKPTSVDGLTVSAFAKNVGRKVYSVWNQNIQFTNTYSIYGEPRVYGVELDYEF